MSIHDKFSELNISRQRKYQMRHHAKGLCLKCSNLAMEGFIYCKKHHKWLLKSRDVKHHSLNTRFNRLIGKV